MIDLRTKKDDCKKKIKIRIKKNGCHSGNLLAGILWVLEIHERSGQV